MPNIYNYKASINKRIARAVEHVLRAKVLDVAKMGHGEINYVYRINTDKGAVIARVFRYENHPADGMLQWIEKQLTKRNIRHAKLLYYSRDSKFFPNGFMVSECIEGLNGLDDYDAGIHTIAQSFNQSGKILKKIHQIKAKRYGKINYGKGESADFIEMEIKQVKAKVADLVNRKALPKDIFNDAERAIRNSLEPYKKTFHPVLIHGDASRENSIWLKGKKYVLIDWDNAMFSIWLRDFIEYSWWNLHLPEWKSEEKRKTARQAFFRGYGKVEYTPKEIDQIQYGLHLIKSIEKLHYYFFDKKDTRNFKLVKKVFFELLKR